MKTLDAGGALVTHLALFSSPLSILIFLLICFWGKEL